MDDYHEFCDAHEADIEEWRWYWLPNYFSITKGRLAMPTPTPSTIITGAGVDPSTHGGGGSSLIVRARVLLVFHLVTEFFEELHTNYQGVTIEKLRTL
ncbi:unnamed protein product [Sphagnum balticum]